MHSVREPPVGPSEALMCTLHSRVLRRRGSAVLCPGMSAELFFTEGHAGASSLLQQMVYWLLVSLFWIVAHVWTGLADRPHTAASWCANVTKTAQYQTSINACHALLLRGCCLSTFKADESHAAERLCLWCPAGTAPQHPACARSAGWLTPPLFWQVRVRTL